MGTSIRAAILVCCDCSCNIYSSKVLVAGSQDPNDLRCPECGSSQFNCGYCRRTADRFAKDVEGKVTWNCFDGCNP